MRKTGGAIEGMCFGYPQETDSWPTVRLLPSWCSESDEALATPKTVH
ncbi:MAG: hypothetical protein ACI9X4_000777 [Glaciecola sp.]|jgi:hypothetical protein